MPPQTPPGPVILRVSGPSDLADQHLRLTANRVAAALHGDPVARPGGAPRSNPHAGQQTQAETPAAPMPPTTSEAEPPALAVGSVTGQHWVTKAPTKTLWDAIRAARQQIEGDPRPEGENA